MKRVGIQSFSSPHFPAFELYTERYFPYSVRLQGKYWPENLRSRTFFTQWMLWFQIFFHFICFNKTSKVDPLVIIQNDNDDKKLYFIRQEAWERMRKVRQFPTASIDSLWYCEKKVHSNAFLLHDPGKLKVFPEYGIHWNRVYYSSKDTYQLTLI